MDKFKYIVVVNGSYANRLRFADELEKLGYFIPRDNCCISRGHETLGNYALTVNYQSNSGSYTKVVSGQIEGYSNGAEHWKGNGVKYHFNINNEQEFQCAIAIAAIRDDENNSYLGEVWSYGLGKYKIVKSNGESQVITGFGKTNYATWEYGKINTGVGSWRKAFPEEIIEHSTNKTINMACTNSKRALGYNLKDSKHKSAVLKLFVSGTCLGRDNGYFADMTKEENISIFRELGLLDSWFTPVYENTEIKLGGYVAIKEGDTVAFGCQKFDLPELYAYKKLLASSETKAELSIHGTKITVEILEKLIQML